VVNNSIIQNLTLRPFTEGDYDGIINLKNLLYPDHPTSLESMRHRDITRDHKIQHKQWVSELNSNIIGSVLYTQWEEIYHPQKFVIKIYIHPQYQNQGYGTICYNHLIKALKPFDPIKISTEVHEPHEQSIRFFENRGFMHTISERESSLDLTSFKPEKFEQKIAQINQQGFQLITLKEFRKIDSKADYKVWEFEREVSPDMPWPDPIHLPEFDIYYRQIFNHPKFNEDAWFLVIDGGYIAGLNNLWKSEIPLGLNNGLTGVRRKYRRKGIATALKYNSMTWAKDNGYKWIRTDNAATNESMLNINIKAGFKFMPAWLLYEKVLKEDR